MKAITGIIFCIVLFGCSCNSNKKPDTTKVENITDEVLQQMQDDITAYPDSVLLYDNLIDTLTQRKQYQQAANWCNIILKKGIENTWIYWVVKADIYRQASIFDSAVVSYQIFLRRFPDDEEVLLKLANTYAEAGNRDCFSLGSQIVQRYPTREMRANIAFVRGIYYTEHKQYDSARMNFDSCILLNYTFPEAYMEKGYILYDLGKYTEAFQSFSTLSQINNGYAEAWYWMAKSQEALGKNQEAMTYFEQAYALDRSIEEARLALDRLEKSNRKK